MKFNPGMLNKMALRAASPPSEQALGGAALLPLPTEQDEMFTTASMHAGWLANTRAKISKLRATSMIWVHS